MSVSEQLANQLFTDAGVKISGTNAEVMPAQWEYQIGPCDGIESTLQPTHFTTLISSLTNT
jgi:glutamine synthetase